MTTASPPKTPALHPLSRLMLAVLPVAVAGTVGSMVTLPNIPVWYAHLAKPPMTPPNAAFGPAWTLLYVLMAYGFWRVLGHAPTGRGRLGGIGPIGAFAIQLALNAGWSIAFFGLHNPGLGLVVIAALIAAIITTMVLFSRVDRPAFWLLTPYLAWVLFATYLNFGVWRLNG